MTAHAPSAAGEGDPLRPVRRWGLLAVMAVTAMVPWYTLRLFPLLTIGTAKVNLLDALVGVTVLAALPSIATLARRRNGPVLWVLAFLCAMLVPLAVGLRAPDAAPRAIREFRALAFYALAPAFAAEASVSPGVPAFAASFVAGACAAIAAVFAHLRWLVPLPGYAQDTLLAPAGFVVHSFSWNEHMSHVPTIPVAAGVGYRADYLEWTVPLVAFTLSLGGVLSASSRWERGLWGAAVAATSWYLLVSGARSPQITAVCVALVLGAMLRRRGQPVGLRLAGAAAVIVLLGALAVGVRSPGGGGSVGGPLYTTLLRWSQLNADDSLRLRLKEIVVSLPAFARHPIFGEGLGGVIPIPEFAFPGQEPRVIASGYGFLLIKTGLVGLFLYLVMVGSVLRLGWRRIRSGTGAGSGRAPLIGVVGIAAFLMLNLVHPVVDIPEGAIAFSLFFGMIVAQAPQEASGRR